MSGHVGAAWRVFHAAETQHVANLLWERGGLPMLAARVSFFVLLQGFFMSLRLHAARWVRSTRAALILLLATHAFAAPPAQFQSALALFAQARAGDASAIDAAASAFSALLETEPGNPVLMAYAGAATALQATSTWLPWKKMRYAEDGLALLDKSLALLTPAHNAVLQNGPPAALEVRFVAANTFLAVPGFMNRGARGAKLLAEVLASPLLAQSPAQFQGAVRLRAAALAKAQAS